MSTDKPKNGSIRTMSRPDIESNQISGTALESNPQTEFDMASNRDAQTNAERIPETKKTPEPPTNIEPKSTTEPEPPTNDIKLDTYNQPSFKDIAKANVVLSNFKTDVPTQDIIINIDGPEKNAGDIKNDKDYLVYEYFGQHIRPQRTTWVFFEGEEGGVPQSGSSRNYFIKIVFLILLAMLLITGAFVTIVFMTPSLKGFFRRFGFPISIGSSIAMIGLCYATSCSECTRKFPGNVIVLVLSVVFMSCMCSYACCKHSSAIVFIALAATAALVLFCFLLALSPFDFTRFYLYIVMIAAAIFFLGIILLVAKLAFGFYMKPLHIAITVAATIIQTVILAMELQMVIGGRTIELGEDEYTLGAFMLYTSIVYLFLHLLTLAGFSFEDVF